MANLYFDDFGTATPGDDLSTYDSNWAKESSVGGTSQILISSANRLRDNAAPVQYYRLAAAFAPPTANYSVSVTIFSVTDIASPNQSIGILGRYTNGSSFSGYMARYLHGTGVQLFKAVSAAFTQIGSTFSLPSLGSGISHTLKLTMNGTTITVNWDGTDQIVVTDSAVSSTGTIALRNTGVAASNTTGYHWDNLSADTLSSVIFRRTRSSLGTRIGSRQRGMN